MKLTIFCFLSFLCVLNGSGDGDFDSGSGGVFPANTRPHYPVSHQQEVHLTREEAHAQDYHVGNPLQDCNVDEFTCTSPKQCIPKGKRCDNHVDCMDATDEKMCGCVSRLHVSKLCDFFYDCPHGEDELGCFGCDKDEFSCYENASEYENRSIMRQCYKRTDICNRVRKCSNWKDEFDCSVIVSETEPFTRTAVPTIEGILFHQYEGQMYPVCQDGFNWTEEVCKSMMGANFRHWEIEYAPTDFSRFYVSSVVNKRSGIHKFMVQENCPGKGPYSGNVVLRVKCIAKSECGDNKSDRVENEGFARVAGGHEAIPESNPWLVSLFLNGSFQCGGVIIGNKSVLTAAHCLYSRGSRLSTYDYLEVRGGSQRLGSFSPNEQVVRVDRGMIHEKYKRKTLKNDIALLELEDTLLFNKWVQPICFPTNKSVGHLEDRQWIWGPHYNSICKIAGWGGRTWRGPFPVDRQMEAYVPISNCNLTNEHDICAGYKEGGFDTCVGDSGGPLVCRSKENDDDLYLAGIASAGYSAKTNNSDDVHCGEKDTYGTYVGLTWYIQWIEKMQVNEI